MRFPHAPDCLCCHRIPVRACGAESPVTRGWIYYCTRVEKHAGRHENLGEEKWRLPTDSSVGEES